MFNLKVFVISIAGCLQENSLEGRGKETIRIQLEIQKTYN